ncbi:MAG TPA: ABC transporter permease [Anaerolineae bacterium]|nr:ABC transporter permease [Anaerolineae bacterium]HQI84110.1 ABC transporter permease [Anaerolineae bacterium]
MILKNLFGRKARTLLTVFGIAVGVAAVIALGAMGDGFIQGYSAMAGGSGADILVVQDNALDIMFSAVDQDVAPILAAMPGVAAVSEMVYTFAATDAAPYFIVYGYDPRGFAIQHFKIIEGVPLSNKAAGKGGRPLLLGRAAAADQKKKVGDTFRLYESGYRIVGIYETGEPFEDGAAVVLLEDAQRINGKPRQVNALLLKVREGTDLDALGERIERRFDKLTATQSADFADEQEMLQYIYVFTWSVSLVAIIIGGVGVMNTMLMSVFERTKELGVLRAVGWRPRQVLGMILGESLLMSLLGGGVGLLLGLWAVRAVQKVPAINSIMPPQFSAGLLVQGLVVALGLGLVGGGLPAWRASRLAPAEAMRAEGGVIHGKRHVRWAALRNILRQPTRTLLTVVGIGVALMAIVLLGAMSDGLMDAFGGMMVGGGAHLIGIERDASVDLSKIDEDIVRRIGLSPGVQAAEGFLTGYTTLGDLPFFIVFGYQPRGRSIRTFPIVEGAPLSTNRQIILGRVAATNLRKRVGQTVRIFDSTFKIVGIYETGVAFQDGGGVVTLRDAQNLFGQTRKVSFLGVWLQQPEQADIVKQDIEARFPQVSLGQASTFTENLVDMQMMKASTWGIALMAIVVGGLGMTNTMVMSVIERTREIGVLRALGWRRRRVLGMIVRESATLSLLGGMAGTLVGVLLGYALNLHPLMQGYFRMEYSVGLFAQAFGVALVLGVIGGVYPAWRASNLQPVEALRYE